MQSSTGVKLILILASVVLSLYLLYPTYQLSVMSDAEKERIELEDKKSMVDLKSKSINLGLDLQGGMHVVLEVDIKELLNQLAKNKTDVFVSSLEKSAREVEDSDEDFINIFYNNLTEAGGNLVRFYGSRDMSTEDAVLTFLRDQISETVTRALEILQNRVDEFGVSEPIIQKQGESRIIIELAGVTDPSRVRELIGKTAKLEFRLLKDSEIYLSVAEKINKFIQSKISPLDTVSSDEEESGESADSSLNLDELFGTTASDSQVSDSAVAKADPLFEQNLFFLDPNSRQNILVPAEKESKFRRIIELEDVYNE